MFRRQSQNHQPEGEPQQATTTPDEGTTPETIVITAAPQRQARTARQARPPRAPGSGKPKRAARSASPYRAALVIREDRVTVIGQGVAEGPLTDLKALAGKARASGSTVAVMTLTRTREEFTAQEDALSGIIQMRSVRDGAPYTGVTVMENGRREALLETVPGSALVSLRASLKGTRLTLSAVTGIPEVAARSAPAVITADRPGGSAPGLWAISSADVMYVTGLKSSETLEQVVINADGLIPGGASGIPVVLTGAFTPADAEQARNLLGGDAALLSDEQLGRAAMTAPDAGGLGSLLLRVPSTSSVTPGLILPPLGMAAALGLVSAALWVMTGQVQAETTQLQQQDQALAPTLAQVRALKRENDQAQHDLDTARTLSSQKGNLAPDLLQLARTISGVQGAKLSALTGPNPGGTGSAFDGKTVIATYAVNAHTTSRQGAESLIAELNLDPYALDTRTVTCKADAGCVIDATIGLTRRDPQ